jgi:hypothetical protein
MLSKKHRRREQNDNYGSVTPSRQLFLVLQAIPSKKQKNKVERYYFSSHFSGMS